jgi:hypothetical protein
MDTSEPFSFAVDCVHAGGLYALLQRFSSADITGRTANFAIRDGKDRLTDECYPEA